MVNVTSEGVEPWQKGGRAHLNGAIAETKQDCVLGSQPPLDIDGLGLQRRRSRHGLRVQTDSSANAKNPNM